MAFINLLRRQRRRPTRTVTDAGPPVIITVRKMPKGDPMEERSRGGASRREGVGSDVPADDCELEHRPPPPNNVAVRTRVILKDDRFGSTDRTSGDQVDALDRLERAIYALVTAINSLALVVLWGILLLSASHCLKWSALVVFVLCLAVVFVGAGAILLNRGLTRFRRTDKKASPARFVPLPSCTESCTDISALAD